MSKDKCQFFNTFESAYVYKSFISFRVLRIKSYSEILFFVHGKIFQNCREHGLEAKSGT